MLLSTLDIKKIRDTLKEKPRDLLLFDLALHTGVKLKDLLELKVKDLIGLEIGDKIPFCLGYKNYNDNMDATVYESFNRYMNSSELMHDDYLFKLQNSSRPLSPPIASIIIRGWFEAARIDGNHGAVSLRKTWESTIKQIHEDSYHIQSQARHIFRPINTNLIQDMIYEKLSKGIISGKILPGTRLPAIEIAKAFNVSQAPVRVALHRLESKGLIISPKKKASFVKPLFIEEFNEITELRCALELFAIRSTVKVCTSETISLLDSIVKREKNTATWAEKDRLNTEFHLTLYRDANMPILIQMLRDLCDRAGPYAIIQLSEGGNKAAPEPKSGKSVHDKILQSLRSKNHKETVKYVKQDVKKKQNNLEDILQNRKNHDNGIITEELLMSLKDF